MVFCSSNCVFAAKKPAKNIKVTSEVISEKSALDGPVKYDDGMATGTKYEYCYVITTSVIRVKGDMAGQPTHGTDRCKGEGFIYVCDDTSTKKTEKIDVSITVGGKAISAGVSVPINIFKNSGKSKAKVQSSTILASKKGRYKAYGNVTYTVKTYTSFKRPDTRGKTKEQKKKIKWTRIGAYKKTTVVPRTDSSICRYIGEYGKD